MNAPVRWVKDTFANLLTGLGVIGQDRNAASQYVLTLLAKDQLDNAYRGDWVARKCVDIPALDATREWRRWQADKSDITDIEDEEQRLDIQRKVKRAMIRGRLYGGGALIMGFDKKMGEAADPLEIERIPQGGLKWVHYFSCNELTAGELQTDINDEWFGEPKFYTLTSREQMIAKIHPSRVIRFLGAELTDPALSSMSPGWGDPIIQVINDAVKNVGLVSQAISALVMEAKLDVVKIENLDEHVSTKEYRDNLIERMMMTNSAKSLVSMTLLDKRDDWDRKQISFGSLDDVMKVYLLIASGAADIPATRLLGQTPVGLNATGEGDLRNYYDRIRSEQQTEITPAMHRLDEAIMQSTFGTQPDGIWFEWAPLWATTEEERSKIAYSKAQTFQIDFNSGLIPEDALREGRENQLIEDGTYPGLEQAIEEAEAAQEAALNELDPEVREQAEQHLLAAKAGVPMLPPPAPPGGPQSDPNGEGEQPPPPGQKTNQRPPGGAGDSVPRRSRYGYTADAASRGGMRQHVKGRSQRRRMARARAEVGWLAKPSE